MHMDELSAPFAAELRDAHHRSRAAEARKVEVLAALADVYKVDTEDLMPILAERHVSVSLDGPTVSEFLCLEVAGLLGCSPTAAAGKIADAVNVKHRHPSMFNALQELQVDAARACKAAQKCSDLPGDVAERVTDKWLRTQHKLSWASAFNLLAKLMIDEDPEAAAKKERKSREQLGVHFWGHFNGTMNLTGRLGTLDARYVEAAVERIAEILRVEDPDSSKDNLRARALGVLANPAYALALIQQAAQPGLEHPEQEAGLGVTSPEDPHAAPRHEASAPDGDSALVPEPAGPQRHDPHACSGHLCGTVTTPLHKLRPSLGIAVHLHVDALGDVEGSARIEKAGHVALETLADLLRGVDVQLHPVIDLNQVPPEDQYVPSTGMRRALRLTMPTEMFPYSNRSSRGLDLDHTQPYRTGVREQTRIGNLAPFSRRVHRAKTAGIWTVHQPSSGLLEWRSPLGFRYQVGPDGTRRRE